MEQIEQIIEKWDEILNTVKEEHEISEVSFNTWLKPLSVFAVENNKLYILVPDEQIGLSYITKKFLLPIRVSVAEITGTDYEIEFILPEQTKKIKPYKAKNIGMTESGGTGSALNPNYTFDTFVVGNNNKLAYAASLADVFNGMAWRNRVSVFYGTYYITLGRCRDADNSRRRYLQKPDTD